MSFHAVHRSHKHLTWDNSLPPVLTINSGDTVTFDCLDASNGQVQPTSLPNDLDGEHFFAALDPVFGPVYITNAEPGDVLQIDVLALELASHPGPSAALLEEASTWGWGWTALIPGFGLLAAEFDAAGLTPALRAFDLDAEHMCVWFDREKGIRVPLRPFCGEMGVARGQAGKWSTIPPYATGGNIDTRHLGAGATVYLPVEVPGALFSCGDGHAAQGDGEVCGTAIETSIKATFRFTVRKDKPYTRTMHFQTPSAPAAVKAEEYYCTTGVEPDVAKAAQAATRNMIDYLCAEHGLSRVDAYMLCSIAGDLRLHEVVDMPNYVVGMMMPLSIFGHKPLAAAPT